MTGSSVLDPVAVVFVIFQPVVVSLELALGLGGRFGGLLVGGRLLGGRGLLFGFLLGGQYVLSFLVLEQS